MVWVLCLEGDRITFGRQHQQSWHGRKGVSSTPPFPGWVQQTAGNGHWLCVKGAGEWSDGQSCWPVSSPHPLRLCCLWWGARGIGFYSLKRLVIWTTIHSFSWHYMFIRGKIYHDVTALNIYKLKCEAPSFIKEMLFHPKFPPTVTQWWWMTSVPHAHRRRATQTKTE